VKLSNNSTLFYNQLIIATGGDPRVLPFPGNNLSNIFVMRNAEDVTNVDMAMSQFSAKKPDVVIVGSSFIGMEAASILSKVANVTVIGMEKYPFERVLGVEVGEAMLKLNKHNGINMEMQQLVEKYEAAKGDSKRVGAVVLKGGKSIPADLVILGAGVIPKTDFLKSSGIPLDKDQGISVTASMEIPNFEGIYAVGDIARYPYHVTGENVRVEHWNVAQNQGRLAAEAILAKIAGKPAPIFKHIPYFWYLRFFYFQDRPIWKIHSLCWPCNII
jgi:NADPH-dependent 2,4-dienoyl-CoA reductase/sulfur reductase-like enzyme